MNILKARIKDIAKIQTGLYAKPEMQGNALYLQVKYFDEYGEINRHLKPDALVDEKMRKHILLDGDILFMAKGSRNAAVIFRSLSGEAVASSSFIVVRLNERFKSQILPEFLAWFINHPRSQELLKTHSKGSGIPSIALSGFSELEVTVPDIETQKSILTIQMLRTKEKQLINEINKLKDLFIQNQLFLRIQE